MNAIIYSRYSPRPVKKKKRGQSDQQDRLDSRCESCDTQEEFCRRWCADHDLAVEAAYRDEGLSGKDMDNRPGLTDALEHVKRIRGVFVAYSLSRWARSTRDAAIIAESLQQSRCQLASIKESIDTATPYGRAMYGMMAVFAQLEREVIVERTQDAMLRYQANGRRMSDQTPYGWARDPGFPAMLVENPQEQDVIEWVEDLAEHKWTYYRIAAQLTSQGVRSRTGGVIHRDLVRRILARSRRMNGNGNGVKT